MYAKFRIEFFSCAIICHCFQIKNNVFLFRLKQGPV